MPEMNEAARVNIRAGVETLLIHPAHAEIAVTRVKTLEAMGPEAFDRMRGDKSADQWGAYRVENGTALIPIMGTLIPRGTFVGSGWGVTSYEGLRTELRRAAADSNVSRIALMIDSPGGYVSGIDATAAAIRKASELKPVTAYVQGMAASAAYWLASQADEIIASELAELGSIGVVQMHVDYSKILEDAGLKVTLLFAGARKVDGNPYGPLPDSVKADMLQRLEDLRGQFAAAVAEGRELDIAAVLATEADTFFGQAALDRGLADRIGLLDEELAVRNAPSGLLRMEKSEMDKEFTKADLDAAVATARTESHTSGKAEGFKEGATAERERVKGIMTAEAAGGRESLAKHFAYSTDMPVAACVAALAEAPKAAANSTQRTLDEEMNGDVKPGVGGNGGPNEKTLTGAAKGAAEMKAALGL